MPLRKTQAVVIGRMALGESDRLATFYTREFGKVRGVAKSARRPRSRFGGGLELFTQGQLLFFETERSDLARVDSFDIVHPFQAAREDLERLMHGSWVVECLGRLSADRDPSPALYGLLLRTLRALEGPGPPSRAAFCFALRAVDLLGHRLRLDRCMECGKPSPPPARAARLDFAAGGLVCEPCARYGSDGVDLSGGAVAGLRRLRTVSWEEALGASLSPSLEAEMAGALEAQMARLIGQVPRTTRFRTQAGRPLGASR
ncbi:MAG: DNA repair protein RecO [Candidatus Rokubacteria bacterium]|nr:DNA repair protein RecO [Candidatus Rokubacteria bacterium]